MKAKVTNISNYHAISWNFEFISIFISFSNPTYFKLAKRPKILVADPNICVGMTLAICLSIRPRIDCFNWWPPPLGLLWILLCVWRLFPASDQSGIARGCAFTTIVLWKWKFPSMCCLAHAKVLHYLWPYQCGNDWR